MTLSALSLRPARLPARLCAALALLGCASAFSVQAGTSGIDASGSYQSEIAACKSGQTQQDVATCLTEARNAQAEKKRGRLDVASGNQLSMNAAARCDVLRGEDKAACQLRMQGQGSTSGSVAGGGLLREITTEVPAESAMAPAAPMPTPMSAPSTQTTVR